MIESSEENKYLHVYCPPLWPVGFLSDKYKMFYALLTLCHEISKFCPACTGGMSGILTTFIFFIKKKFLCDLEE